MIKNILFYICLYLIFIGTIKSCDGPDSDTTLKPWSSASTWGSTGKPVAGSVATISTAILLDESTPRLQQIAITSTGKLVVSSKHGALNIYTGGILINGSFIIGDDACRYNGSVTITLTGTDGVSYYETIYDMGRKFIGVLSGGALELHGMYGGSIPSWVFLNKTISSGETLLELSGDVSKWPIGGTIVLGSSDFDMFQSEEVTIVACSTCKANQLKIASPGSKYYHYGSITYGIDERTEVGLLTKNIKIQGEMANNCTKGDLCRFFNFDTLGGHVRIVKGFKSAHIQAVEFTKMGQTYNVGYYPIHFHMCGNVDTGSYASWPSFVKDNSIHHTLSRCLTIHGTSGLIAVGNFAFDNIGHCYFFEDASEERNYLDSNVGLLTRNGYLLPSDRNCELCLYLKPYDYNGNPTSCGECAAVATFWVTNPNNYLKNNIAGGSQNVGIWFTFQDYPSGLSQSLYPNTHPAYTPLGLFVSNKVHSNIDTGMQIDSGLQVTQPSSSTPYQYLSMTLARWRPRVNSSNPDSASVTGEFHNFVAYKNKWRALWARGGDMLFSKCQIADNAIGATVASEGDMPADPGSSQRFDSCTFVAQTDNIGQATNGINVYNGRPIPAWQQFTVRGIEIYDGPMSVSYSSFIGFKTDGYRNMSGIGWLLYNDWQFGTKNKFYGNSFINSDKVLSLPVDYDGTKNEILYDQDGTITGKENSYVVPNVPYFLSNNCEVNKNWNMSSCLEKYGSLYIYNMDVDHSNIPNGSGIKLVRDEQSSYKHEMHGIPIGNPRKTFLPVVMIGKSYTLYWTHPTPPNLRIQMTNFDKSDYVIVGLCYPPSGVTFNIQRQVILGWQINSTQVTLGSSYKSVQDDSTGLTGYFDSSVGLLFLKFQQNADRSWAHYCPESGCEVMSILASGSSVNNVNYDCYSAAYPKYAQALPAATPYCPQGIDACGKCGGDGSSCGLI